MLTVWAVYALGVSICVAVVAFAVEQVLAIWTLPRRMAWIAALLFAAVVPAGMAMRHTPIAAARALPRATRSRTLTGRVARVVPRQTPVRLRLLAAAVRANPYVERAWALASLLAVGVFARGIFGLARRRTSWREVRLRGGVVLVARDAGPAVVGALRPEIVVPECGRSLSMRPRYR